MIKSMTGFGKSHFSDENLNLDIEIKTVNSRYLDTNIRMPYQLNFMEDKINKLIKDSLSRGRVDVFIRSKKKNLANSKITLDLEQAKLMHESLLEISDITGIASDTITISNILKNEDVLKFETDELDEKVIIDAVSIAINQALEEVIKMRKIEGESLYKDLLSNLDILEVHKNEIENYSEDIKLDIRSKLEKNISDILDSNVIDEDRLANEIVFFADKHDINEEITRLNSHINQFRDVVNSDVSVGKKLDFITQEMLRETNTIGSKSYKIDITNIVIEMKTIIEKIKEQVQNVE